MSEETKRIVISNEDYLASENMQLKAIALGREIQLFEQRIQQLMDQHKKLVDEINKTRQELESKYGINLLTHIIDPTTHEVIPRATASDISEQLAKAAAAIQGV